MKKCKYCHTELKRKCWFGKRIYREALKRFNQRQYCDNTCRSKQLSVEGKGINNYFYGKHLIPWNKGNRVLSWKTKDSHGYIRVFNRIKGNKVVFRYEHRIVWEREKQEILSNKDVIHHINSIKNDNRIENLLKCNHKTHRGLHKNA